MKKIILLGCVLLTTVCLTFADGTCKDHGDYSGSYCPTCEYNRGSNLGSSAANSGSAYNDKKCREVNRGNYIQSNWVDRENQNQVKDCVDGYKEAYGEREWCSTLLVPGDFNHSVTGEKSQKVTRGNDQKSHLTPLIIRFPEDCQKQFLPFL